MMVNQCIYQGNMIFVYDTLLLLRIVQCPACYHVSRLLFEQLLVFPGLQHVNLVSLG